MAPLFHVEALLPSSKIDSILQSHIYPQVGHVFRAVAKFKALLVDVLSKKRTPARATAGYYDRSRSAARSGKKSKIASFVTKLQFVSSSSSARAWDQLLDVDRARYSYYDSAWDVVVSAEMEEVRGPCGGGGGDEMAECGYLCWLEEERSGGAPAAAEEGGEDGESTAVNEIDKLAEKFIARFHAKFLLEKQESYRRYQEMIARSV